RRLNQPIRAESQAKPSNRTPSTPNISRCRWGPVDWPVLPTRPTCWPAVTESPTETASEPYCMCAYELVMSSPPMLCCTSTLTPSPPPFSVASTTTPSAIDMTGVPSPGLKSMPSWNVEHPPQGADLGPKPEARFSQVTTGQTIRSDSTTETSPTPATCDTMGGGAASTA